jgi:hypothetical protein
MRYRKIIIILIVPLILALLWILNLNKQRDIVIQEAKMVTGVDKQMRPAPPLARSASKICLGGACPHPRPA